MSDIQTLIARLRALDPHADPELCKACMQEAAETLAGGRADLTIGSLAPDGTPETLALGEIWFDRRETTEALCDLLAAERARSAPAPLQAELTRAYSAPDETYESLTPEAVISRHSPE